MVEMMRVFVIGSGGREHALCWKLKQSPEVQELYAAPGNGGMAGIATCVPISLENIQELAEFAQSLQMDLTVVGPELPLTLGIVDEFIKRGLPIFGPKAVAAELEGSKIFAKQFMLRHQIPTPGADFCESEDELASAVKRRTFPFVLKADGLAAGKGVLIIQNRDDLDAALRMFFRDKRFGRAGTKVLVEDFLQGEEVSFMVLADGTRALPLASAKDYKRAGDGDSGPNTGGMGSHSPAVVLNKEDSQRIHTEIIQPTLAGMAEEGREYRGVLYAGLMLTADGPKVLEYNCRFGDPETQAILPRLDMDLLPLLLQSARGKFAVSKLEWKKEAVACVVLAARGYPDDYARGFGIEGLEEASQIEGVMVFHAGTALKDGTVVTSGGRVLGVCGKGATLAQAISRAYVGAREIRYENKYHRTDIGQTVLKRMHHA
jgi:phosphoribosylamine---glycine ligase